MVRREIGIDEDTDRILTELASEHKGDLSQVLAELVHGREGLDFADKARRQTKLYCASSGTDLNWISARAAS